MGHKKIMPVSLISIVHRNLISNYIAQGWTAFLNLAMIPLYLNLLGLESYGLIGIFSVVQACFVALDAGMTPTLNREISRFKAGIYNSKSINDLVFSIEIVCWCILAVIVALGFLGANSIANYWIGENSLSQSTVVNALRLIFIVAALRVMEGVYKGAILGMQKQVFVSTSTAALATLRAFGAYLVLDWFSASIQLFFIWQIIISLFSVGIYAGSSHRLLPKIKGSFNWEILSKIKGFAGAVSGTSILSIGLSQIDKIILVRLLSLELFAGYTIAVTIANSIFQLVNPIVQAYYPRLTELIAQENHEGLVNDYHLSTQLLAAAVMPVALVIIVMSQQILYLWTSNSSLSISMAPVLSLFTMGCLFNAILHMPYTLQLSFGWPSFSLGVNIFSLIFYIPILIFLTYKYGAVGAALTWAILNLSLILISIPLMHKRLLPKELGRWYWEDILVPLMTVTGFLLIMGYYQPQNLAKILELIYLVFITLIAFLICIFSCSKLRSNFIKFAFKSKKFI